MLTPVPGTWAERVASLRDELPLDLARAVITTWEDDPYSREAYTALTIGMHVGDENLMKQPIGRLHFAGEHTAGDWAGLMEGALRSGERVAREIASQMSALGPLRNQPSEPD